MKYHIVSIRDIKANTFGPLVQTTSIGAAIRSFSDQCTGTVEGDPTLRNHPEDFELFHMGYYDDETGEFEKDRDQLQVGSVFKKQLH